eukprot:2833848-Pleurochrysis_carterae.AAC.2
MDKVTYRHTYRQASRHTERPQTHTPKARKPSETCSRTRTRSRISTYPASHDFPHATQIQVEVGGEKSKCEGCGKGRSRGGGGGGRGWHQA